MFFKNILTVKTELKNELFVLLSTVKMLQASSNSAMLVGSACRLVRKQNACHIAFTLDAGANVHMLFPEKDRALAMSFIDTQLIEHCSNAQYICDNVGSGPQKLEC